MTTTDGGPAFPVECYFDETGPRSGVQTSTGTGFATGISIRDYFAAKALSSMDLHTDGIYSAMDHKAGIVQKQAMSAAKAAYRYADAMLAARGNRHD